MTAELQQTRYDQLIRRVGGIIGPGSKVSEALSELFPVIDVERVPGELLLLGGTQLCFGAASLTSAVAERPHIQLFNPAGSGKLITVSSLAVSAIANVAARYAVVNAAVTTGVGTERFRDGRLGLVARPVGQIRTDSLVAIVNADTLFRVGSNDPVIFKDENSVAVLSPGFGLSVGLEQTNSVLIVTFNWRERVAEQSELLFS